MSTIDTQKYVLIIVIIHKIVTYYVINFLKYLFKKLVGYFSFPMIWWDKCKPNLY